MSSFPQGLSGLNAASKSLEVIGNNIANANTVGAKASRAEFSHVYTAALGLAGAAAGTGVRTDTVAQQFTQGNISGTGISTDLAISGDGFFQVNDGVNPTMYTRNGQFKVNNVGEIVNNDGLHLMGYTADAKGQIVPGALQPLQLPTAALSAHVTNSVTMAGNLDSSGKVTNPVAVATAKLDAANLVKTQADAAKVTANATKESADAAKLAADEAKVTADAAKVAADTELAADPSNPDLIAAAAAAATAATNAATAATNAATAATNAATAAANADAAATSAATSVATATSNLAAATAGPAIDFSDASTYNNATSQTVYDEKGQGVTLTYYFQKAADDTWNVFATANGTPLNGTAASPLPMTTQLKFGAGGATIASAPVGPIAIPSTINAAGATTQPITLEKFDFSGFKQQRATFAITKQEQDGFAPGNVTSVSVQEDGTVMALYSNNKSFAVGQVELAKFVNPQGLQPLSGNLWAGTPASGEPVRGTPGNGVVGKLQSEALEDSNVDVASELVNMITAQRSYQANAQTIKTQDQVMQTLINLR
jgi:flagellar hook protein FlgE